MSKQKLSERLYTGWKGRTVHAEDMFADELINAIRDLEARLEKAEAEVVRLVEVLRVHDESCNAARIEELEWALELCQQYESSESVFDVILSKIKQLKNGEGK